MLWIKDGKLFDGRLEIDGRVSFVAGEPDPDLMRRCGWREYSPPAPIPSPVIKRYSKLKIIRALGEAWAEKKAALEAAGLLDQFMAAQYLADDDPAFAAVYISLTDAEKAALEECQYEDD